MSHIFSLVLLIRNNILLFLEPKTTGFGIFLRHFEGSPRNKNQWHQLQLALRRAQPAKKFPCCTIVWEGEWDEDEWSPFLPPSLPTPFPSSRSISSLAHHSFIHFVVFPPNWSFPFIVDSHRSFAPSVPILLPFPWLSQYFVYNVE